MDLFSFYFASCIAVAVGMGLMDLAIGLNEDDIFIGWIISYVPVINTLAALFLISMAIAEYFKEKK